MVLVREAERGSHSRGQVYGILHRESLLAVQEIAE
jgi:hypothetical protein